MIRIGPLALEEKAAVVAVRTLLKPQGKPPKWEPIFLRSGWICLESGT